MMNNFDFDKNQMQNLEKFNNMMTSYMFKMMNFFGRAMDFFSKNTKLIYLIIGLFILFKIGSYVWSIEPKGIYEITTSSGVIYANKIELKDGCVYFDRISDGRQIIICGGFRIVKSK
jgi:hypothetical protein